MDEAATNANLSEEEAMQVATETGVAVRARKKQLISLPEHKQGLPSHSYCLVSNLRTHRGDTLHSSDLVMFRQ
jgi:hypothetical protein